MLAQTPDVQLQELMELWNVHGDRRFLLNPFVRYLTSCASYHLQRQYFEEWKKITLTRAVTTPKEPKFWTVECKK